MLNANVHKRYGVLPTEQRKKGNKMKVLVACEESQAVCKAFRANGHEAYSCDIIESSGGHPEWHIKQDVLALLNGKCKFLTMDGKEHQFNSKWDLIIAHPPCTYMSNAGACRMYPRKGELDLDRYQKALEAKAFFMAFLNADCPRIAIENPRPLKVVGLPEETQRIQPFQFGEPYSKLTYLWLKNLPPLYPTKILDSYKPYISCGTSHNKGNPEKSGVSRKGGASKVRSKTFPGIAMAMAEQWGVVADEYKKERKFRYEKDKKNR